mgnify:CR=1 FL=1
MRDLRDTLPQGFLSGFAGATALAAWFLILDALAGSPFQTPAFLARSFLNQESVETTFGLVALFTLVHYLVFFFLGLFVAWTVRLLPSISPFLVGTVVGFLLFDLVFYAAVSTAGPSVAEELGWPAVLSGNLVAGLAMAFTLHFMEDREGMAWWRRLREQPFLGTGVKAGLWGAVVVAVWFLVLDTVRGQPLMTPAALGAVVFQGTQALGEVSIDPGVISAYTILHLGSFILVGLAASFLLERARGTPHVLVAAALVFVISGALFTGFLAIAAEFLMEAMTWWGTAVGNLMAAVVMGGFLGRRHPELKDLLSGDALGWNQRNEEPG